MGGEGSGGGGGGGGGAGVENFAPFRGAFLNSAFHSEHLYNIHNWGGNWFYLSQQMKNSTVFQQMYLSISKGIPGQQKKICGTAFPNSL